MNALWEKPRRTDEVKLKGDEEQSCVCAYREVKQRREDVVPLILNVGT